MYPQISKEQMAVLERFDSLLIRASKNNGYHVTRQEGDAALPELAPIYSSLTGRPFKRPCGSCGGANKWLYQLGVWYLTQKWADAAPASSSPGSVAAEPAIIKPALTRGRKPKIK